MFMLLKIKKYRDSAYEFLLDGKPVEHRFLKRVNLDMTAPNDNILTLEYHVKDIEVDEIDVEVRRKKEE